MTTFWTRSIRTFLNSIIKSLLTSLLTILWPYQVYNHLAAFTMPCLMSILSSLVSVKLLREPMVDTTIPGRFSFHLSIMREKRASLFVWSDTRMYLESHDKIPLSLMKMEKLYSFKNPSYKILSLSCVL